MTEEMIDPTQTYEAWKEIQALDYMEEKKYEEFKRKCFEYVNGCGLVNRSELEMCMGDAYMYANGEDRDTYSLSYSELAQVSEMVDEYIELMGIEFDENDDVI